MDEDEALVRLIALAGMGAGTGTGASASPDAALLRAVIEEASELGARRALALADEAARDDVGDLRQLLGATTDDAVVAELVRAATGICEAFIGRWLIVREVEETMALTPTGGALRLSARPVVAVDGAVLLTPDGATAAFDKSGYRVTIARDGTAHIMLHDPGNAERVRIAYRAGMASGANAVPEAIRLGLLRMTQYLHEARGDAGTAPPAAIAALWQPWRRMTLGGSR